MLPAVLAESTVYRHAAGAAHPNRSSSRSPGSPRASGNGESAARPEGLAGCGEWSRPARPLLAKLSTSEWCRGASLGVRAPNCAAAGSRGTKEPLGLLPYSEPRESATGDVPSGPGRAIARGAAVGLQLPARVLGGAGERAGAGWAQTACLRELPGVRPSEDGHFRQHAWGVLRRGRTLARTGLVAATGPWRRVPRCRHRRCERRPPPRPTLRRPQCPAPPGSSAPQDRASGAALGSRTPAHAHPC